MSNFSIDAIVSSRGPDTSGPESVRRDTRLLLVSNDAMRARRRPLALFAYYIYQLVLSLAFAWPIARGVAGAFAGHPRGDSVVFDDGGWAVLALKPAYDHASSAIWGLAFFLIVLGSIVGLAPLSALMTSISHATSDTRTPRPRHLAPYVVAMFRPMLVLLAFGTVLELALLAIALWTFSAVHDALEMRTGAARADQWAALVCFGVLVLTAAAAVIHDLARASAVRFRSTAFSAIRAALVTFRRSPIRVMWSWAWRALASTLLVIVVAWIVPRFGVRGAGHRGGAAEQGSFVAIALLHQVVAFSRVSLRASWLARALRAVDAARIKNS